MREAIIEALRKRANDISDAYMRNVGNPARQLVGGGVRGYFGLDAPEYADALGMDAYRNAAAFSNVPGVGAPAGAVKAMAAAPLIAKALRAAPREEALETARKNAVKMLGLPEKNTPMDRAKALGFETGWAHGSPRNDITELRSSRIGAQGPGAYATNYLPEANTYSQLDPGATVYPLMVRKSEALVTGHNNPYDELKVNADDELISELFGRGKSAIVTTQEKTPDWLLKAGAPDMPERQHFVSVKPSNFRSRFAAFDPARVDDADLLGRADPKLLAALAAGTTTAATVSALRNKREEEKKKKREEK
jgi:hypothetical protein